MGIARKMIWVSDCAPGRTFDSPTEAEEYERLNAPRGIVKAALACLYPREDIADDDADAIVKALGRWWRVRGYEEPGGIAGE